MDSIEAGVSLVKHSIDKVDTVKNIHVTYN